MHLIAFSHTTIQIAAVLKTAGTDAGKRYLVALRDGTKIEVLLTDVLADYYVHPSEHVEAALSQTRADLRVARQRVAALEADVKFKDDLLCDHNVLAAQKKSLEDDKRALLAEIENFKDEIRILRTDLTDAGLDARYKRLTEELAAARSALTEARADRGKKSDLQRAYDNLLTGYGNLFKNYDELYKRAFNLERERDEYKASLLDTVNANLRRWAAGNGSFTGDEVAKLRQERDEATVQWRRATVENLGKDATIRALEFELTEARKSAAFWRGKVEDLREYVAAELERR